MTAEPKVSAIITCYNSEAHILRALDSVRRQTRPVDEIIVVDDGSMDGTRERLRGEPGIHLVAQENAGPGASRNAGIRAARGDYLAFLDADDMWLPDKTRRQYEHLRIHPEDVAVSGGKIWWNEEEDRQHSHAYDPRQRRRLRRHLPHVNCVGNPSMVMVRAEALAALGGFDPTIRWGQDWDLWIRLLAHGKIGFLPEDVIVYAWHPANHSHKDPEARQASFNRISRNAIDRLLPHGRRVPAYLRAYSADCAARARLSRAQYRRGRSLLLSATALACYPFNGFGENAKALARAIIGETAYRRLRDMWGGAQG